MAIPMGERRVLVEELHFGYRPDRPVIGGIGFEARTGDVVGLLGRNGSGKSTLLRLLAGLLRPTGGRIEVAGTPAVVADRMPFLESLSARENILGMLALRGLPADDAGPVAEFFLRCYGLAGDADRPVEEFSLGMRRRLALAEGFAADPDLVLLDEPTMGLDPAGRDRLIAMLGDHSADGLAAIVATNDAGFAESVCDRVLFLHGGLVAAEGTPAIMVAALDAPTVLRITTASPPPEGSPPDGLTVIARSSDGLTLSGSRGGRRLPDVWAWLESAGCHVRGIRIREPGLADVFRARTGEELPVPAETD